MSASYHPEGSGDEGRPIVVRDSSQGKDGQAAELGFGHSAAFSVVSEIDPATGLVKREVQGFPQPRNWHLSEAEKPGLGSSKVATDRRVSVALIADWQNGFDGFSIGGVAQGPPTSSSDNSPAGVLLKQLQALTGSAPALANALATLKGGNFTTGQKVTIAKAVAGLGTASGGRAPSAAGPGGGSSSAADAINNQISDILTGAGFQPSNHTGLFSGSANFVLDSNGQSAGTQNPGEKIIAGGGPGTALGVTGQVGDISGQGTDSSTKGIFNDARAGSVEGTALTVGETAVAAGGSGNASLSLDDWGFAQKSTRIIDYDDPKGRSALFAQLCRVVDDLNGQYTAAIPMKRDSGSDNDPSHDLVATGYLYDADKRRCGLLDTVFFMNEKDELGRGREGTPTGLLGIRHDAHFEMGATHGALHLDAMDISTYQEGSDGIPTKASLANDPTLANTNTDNKLESTKWRPWYRIKNFRPEDPTYTTGGGDTYIPKVPFNGNDGSGGGVVLELKTSGSGGSQPLTTNVPFPTTVGYVAVYRDGSNINRVTVAQKPGVGATAWTDLLDTSRQVLTTSPLTGGGDLSADRTIAFLAQTGNTVLASPSGGGSGAPAFRSLVTADLPATEVRPFSDAIALLKNAADATKLVRFDASAISTTTTRTFTLPDATGTVIVTTSSTADVSTLLDRLGSGRGSVITRGASAWTSITPSVNNTVAVFQNGGDTLFYQVPTLFDAVFGNTVGSTLVRSVSGFWQSLTPSATKGQPFVSGGTGADPTYSPVATFLDGGVSVTSGTATTGNLAGTFSDGGTTSTTVARGLYVQPTINYTAASKTGRYEGLTVNVVETSLPSGASYLLRLQAGASGGTDKFTVDNSGAVKTGVWNGTTVAVANGGTGLTSTSQNFVFAGPTSGSGAPTWRALVAGDLPAAAPYSLSGVLATGNTTGANDIRVSLSQKIAWDTGGTTSATAPNIRGATDQGFFITAGTPSGASSTGNALTVTAGDGGATSGTGGIFSGIGGAGAGSATTGGDARLLGGPASNSNGFGGTGKVAGGATSGGQQGASFLAGGGNGSTNTGGTAALAAGSGTSGGATTIAGGDSNAGGSNKASGGLTLSSGQSTGSGTSFINFNCAPTAASGTAANTPATILTLRNGAVAVTSGSPITAQLFVTFSDGGTTSTTTPTGLLVNPTVNYTAASKTGAYTGLKVNVVETSLPSGANRLLSLQAGTTGGTVKFDVDNTGAVKTGSWLGTAIALAQGGTGVDGTAAAQNAVFAGPSGSSGSATFRVLVASDIPNLSASVITSGILAQARGGTGLDTSGVTDGQMLIGNTTGNAWVSGTIGGTANRVTVATGHGTLTLSGPQDIHSAASPTFAGLTLSSPLTIANGGTSLATTPTDGQLLIGKTSTNAYVQATLAQTTNQVLVANGSGTITLSTPQNIHTGATPQFSSMGLGLAAAANQTLTTSTAALTITSGTVSDVSHAPSWKDAGTNSTTVLRGLFVNPTINYTAATKTGHYEGLSVQAVETSLPTGTNYLIRAAAGAAGTTDKFLVDNTGVISSAATANQIVLHSASNAGTVSWTPTTARTLTLPDVTGTAIATASPAADVSTLLDQFGTGRGSILSRGASAWTALAPSVNNTIAVFQNAGDTLFYQLPTFLDAVFGNTVGGIIERASGGWAALTPSSTAGQPLASGGTGADPAYSSVVAFQNTGVALTSGTPVTQNLAGTFSDGGTNSTTTPQALLVKPTINYTAATKTGHYEALRIQAVETSLPTGTNYLIRAIAGSTGTNERFNVDNAGVISSMASSNQLVLNAASNAGTISWTPSSPKTLTIPDVAGTAFTSGGPNTYATGLGPVAQLRGPTDQTLSVTASGQKLTLTAGGGSSAAGFSAALIGGAGAGTDKDAGGSLVSSGNSTGAGTASVQIQAAPTAATGSGVNTPTTVATFRNNGVAVTSGKPSMLSLAATYSDAGTTSTTTAQCAVINPTINYTAASKTGNYTALMISAVETSLPSGQSYLLNCLSGSAGNTSQASIDNTGIIRNSSSIISNGSQSSNGQSIKIDSVSSNVTLSTVGTTTNGPTIPAGALVLGVSAFVTTLITTATNWKISDNAVSNVFIPVTSGLTVGTSAVGNVTATFPFYVSSNVTKITTTGTPGAGAIRVTIHYLALAASTS